MQISSHTMGRRPAPALKAPGWTELIVTDYVLLVTPIVIGEEVAKLCLSVCCSSFVLNRHPSVRAAAATFVRRPGQGQDYFQGEYDRLERLMGSAASPAKLAEMARKASVLSAFIPSLNTQVPSAPALLRHPTTAAKQ